MSLPTPKMPLPGYRLIADNAGSYIDDVNNIRLSNKFTLTRNTADPSAAIDIDLSVILPNSGNTVGRFGLPVLLDRQALTAATVYTQPSFTAEAYRELIIQIDGTDSSTIAFANMTLTGLTGTPNGLGTQTSTSAVSVQDNTGVAATLYFLPGGTADLHCKAHVFPLNTGRRRHYLSNAVSPASTTIKKSDFSGDFPDTTNGATAVVIAFPAFTGIVEVWGIPA